MKLIQESVLITELIFQAELVSYSHERLKVAVDEFDKTAVWSAIQSILISSGNISKILWPIRKKYKERGEHLRQFLEIDSESVLKSRTFRNKFEHYDEFLDDFFKDRVNYSYTDLAMNPSLVTSIGSSCHRGYNSYNNTLLIHGEMLDVNEIVGAVEQLKHKCKSAFS
ncbi:hypothetical protein SAMN04487891_102429 [Flagellimonas taeanensis]|uniref:Uncharacterized protein n=1 Tax=Flagellimonas taeanensis TaxID=1005926 RepID=A0A1M6SF67_9FLAO|nr:hypothetical protein [Allomuricauda taeanensis]SFB80420.1 hypothetical protein SAMN04487891_102429 [Allomuricauda taeanensis]SHK43325.1 hypothetical protein SAMN05216293_1109 [Allomuricauda taeanensis]